MKLVHIYLASMLFPLLCIACGSTEAEKKAQQALTNIELNKSNTAGNEIDLDKFEFDNTLLPIIYNEGIETFLPGYYRNYTPKDVSYLLHDGWMVLSTDDKAHTLSKAKVKIKKHPDECVGDSSTMVATQNSETELLLFKGLPRTSEKLNSLFHSQLSVWVDSVYTFKFSNINYTLRAEGVVIEKWDTEYDKFGRPLYSGVAANYKLYLSTPNRIEQLLIAIPRFDDTFVRIVFIGDLDSDAKPDFIFNTSRNYEEMRVVIFLSSKTKSEELVRCVGECYYETSC